MTEPEPVACAIFLMTAFVIAGFVQSYWLRSEWSKRFRYPIDGGRTFRGHRIFGDNKTWRGFVAIVPSVSLAFVAVRLFFLLLGDLGAAMWPHAVVGYALLGLVAGTGFMIGELPNSLSNDSLAFLPANDRLTPRHNGYALWSTGWIRFLAECFSSLSAFPCRLLPGASSYCWDRSSIWRSIGCYIDWESRRDRHEY